MVTKADELDEADVLDEAPVDDAPVDAAEAPRPLDPPVDDAPVEDAPVEDAPVEDAPVEDAPVEDESLAAADVPPPLTVSPTTSLTAVTVPLIGAVSVVSLIAFWSAVTVS
jgi:HAE1 family hydrophobic/amphiphilic exporter-1